jgi:LysM repeat protein
LYFESADCQEASLDLPICGSEVIIIGMVKKTFALLLILAAVLMLPVSGLAAGRDTLPRLSSTEEVIAAVNALRAENGLPPYTPDPILMSIAQAHAEYILSSGVMTHYDANGLRPFERALQAGYPVAGDIYTNVGFFSENIIGGSGMTAEQAVEEWAVMDEAHLRTMISSELQDIGAGVAVSGYTYIYVIDCGLSTGGTPRAFTPPATYKTPIVTQVPPTPNEDGSVTYIIQPNDTLLGIAIQFGMSLDAIYALNGLTEESIIYPGNAILLSPSFTATPTQATSTPTERPTITSWPTSTPTEPQPSETPVRSAPDGLPASAAGGAVAIIIIAALVIAAILSLTGKKNRSSPN